MPYANSLSTAQRHSTWPGFVTTASCNAGVTISHHARDPSTACNNNIIAIIIGRQTSHILASAPRWALGNHQIRTHPAAAADYTETNTIHCIRSAWARYNMLQKRRRTPYRVECHPRGSPSCQPIGNRCVCSSTLFKQNATAW